MAGGRVREFVADVLLSRRSRERGIYRPHALETMLTDLGVGGRQLWGALNLELWHQKFIDAA
jgi:asparagine synthase (glutamine-hydrolysing)